MLRLCIYRILMRRGKKKLCFRKFYGLKNEIIRTILKFLHRYLINGSITSTLNSKFLVILYLK